MVKVLLILSAAMLLCAITAPPASADTMYTYAGNPFKSFFSQTNGLPAGVSAINGSFTLSNPLGANFSGIVTPLSFSFSDGASPLTQVTAIHSSFSVTTGPTGAITQWNIGVTGGGASVTYPDVTLGTSSNLFSGIRISIDSTRYNLTVLGVTINGGKAFNTTPGTWSSSTVITPTPEPSSLIMLGSGLLGGLGVARRKLSFRAK